MEPTNFRFVVLQHFQSPCQIADLQNAESRREWLYGAGQGSGSSGRAPELAAGDDGLARPPSHFDFMLETSSAGSLVTFALAAMIEKGRRLPAFRLKNHRRIYLDYEGPISGDRGHVQQAMQGSWYWRGDSHQERSFDGLAEIVLVPESKAEINILIEKTDHASGSGYFFSVE